jgi:hypothetical protein
MTTPSKCLEGLPLSYLSGCIVQYKSVKAKSLSRVSPAAMLYDSYGNHLSWRFPAALYVRLYDDI